MKKILFSFCLVLCIFLFFGCEFAEVVTGPRDTWCQRELEVQGVEFDCYLLYSEEGYSHSDLNTEAFPDNKIKPGLTVVLKPKMDNDIIEAFTSSMYTVKHFPLGNQSVEPNENVPEDGNEAKLFNVGNALWNAIWLGNITTFTNNEPSENPPDFMNKKSSLKLEFIDETKEQIKDLSWKEVVIALLENI